MFRIGDFSKMCQVPVSALRYYADLGLLEPAHIDPFTGFRYYTLDQLPRLHRILALKDMGLSLEEIGRLLRDELSPDELRGMFRLQQAKLQQQLVDEQARLARVAARLREIEEEGKMPQDEVVLKTLEPLHMLSVRQVIPTPVYVGNLLAECFAVIGQHGIPSAAPPQAIYHDEEFRLTDMDVEVLLPVAASVTADLPLSGGRVFAVRELPRIESAASIVHVGGYDGLANTYTRLGKWIAANGYRIAGPSREIYLKPAGTDGEAVVEIQWPVER
ncbi:MAG: MerR family transcriptional regulator [Chloroflexi bacterium]|nr:MerR family transcriptional regulator [Chloroflexota bacterium]MCC6893063.1 MerR family transcriptional regulator [Anaerolineae bacterium]